MILDLIVIALFLIFGLVGMRRGFIDSALLMVKTSFSIIIAIVLARPVAGLLNSIFGLQKVCTDLFNTSATNGKLIYIAIIILLIFVLIRLIIHFLRKLGARAKEIKIVKGADSALGFLFGLLRFAFMFCLLSFAVYVITALPFLGGLRTALFEGSTVAKWLYKVVTDLVLHEVLGAAASLIG